MFFLLHHASPLPAAQWKPSILVCLQFVCLNFCANLGYSACWPRTGRPAIFISLRLSLLFLFKLQTKPVSDHLLPPRAKFGIFRIVFFFYFGHRFSVGVISHFELLEEEDYQRGGARGSQTSQTMGDKMFSSSSRTFSV